MIDDTPAHPPKKKKRKSTRRPAAGQAPGALTPAEDAEKTRISLRSLGPEGLVTTRLKTPEDIAAAPLDGAWIDVTGLADVALLTALATRCGLHPLALADIVHTHQRPKTEAYETFVLTILRAAASGLPFCDEQISVVLGDTWVMSVQETGGTQDRFAPVRARIEAAAGKFRSRGPGYIAYALIDAVVDGYFPLLDQYEEEIETLESQAIAEPETDMVAEIHILKRDLMRLRRAVAPQREAIGVLMRDDAPPLTEEVRTHLRDVADHSAQALEMVDIQRDAAQGLMDLHLSASSQRMNEVMKVLTIISVVFMPATFVTGLYGMNFDTTSPYNLPELGWRYGYIWAWGLILIASALLFALFNAYGWISLPKPRRLSRLVRRRHS